MKKTAHIIVLGNEKGGSGKSTTAMHTAISLLSLGYRVGTIDLDPRQGTLTRYIKNRFEYSKRHGKTLANPTHIPIGKSEKENVAEQQAEEQNHFNSVFEELSLFCDFVVIDTPGTDYFLSRLAHSHADTLITPMNDSFIDLDLLANIDTQDHSIKGLSVYADMVMDQRKIKKLRDGTPIDWIIMRNRMSHLNTKNNKAITELLRKISHQANFRLAQGFGERVIFKELFSQGLTLLDLKQNDQKNLTLSQIAARQEVRNLILAIGVKQRAQRNIKIKQKTA